MFARTARLTLRPGWPEDAEALTRAIAYEEVARMTSRVPWPYAESDAAAFLARPEDKRLPSCLILAHENACPQIVGGVGLHVGLNDAQNAIELGYWVTPRAWGRGYATEAARVMVDFARHALRVDMVQAGHFVDNAASGRVLRKLGFVPTAMIPYPSLARDGEAAAQRYRMTFAEHAALVPA